MYCLLYLSACVQNKKPAQSENAQAVAEKQVTQKIRAHGYGGWYCPDNLIGFPAVDIQDWETVPVINGRMPTEEETRSGQSLIYVDAALYPDARPLDMTMPRLATIEPSHSGRQEIIILIQAITVSNDSIVGFRFLNGGNGSARLGEVSMMDSGAVAKLPRSRFIMNDIEIDAPKAKLWDVITSPRYADALQPTVANGQILPIDWRASTNFNYWCALSGNVTSSFGDMNYGNFYIQNDYDKGNYSEKLLLLEDKDTERTTLKMLTGPYAAADRDLQMQILDSWTAKVKELSESKF